jgi:cell division protein FtsW
MLASLLSLPQRLVLLVLLFLLLGQIMLFSATGILGFQQHGSEFYYVSRQLACALVGLCFMFLLSRIRYQVWAKFAYPLIVIQLLLILATLYTHLGHNAQGASRWLRLGPLMFQPSEAAKITLTLFVASFLASLKTRPHGWKRWLIPVPITLSLLVFILKQQDLGSTVILSLVVLGLFFIAGLRLTYLMALVGSAGSFFVFSMLHSDYRRRRVFAFLNPWADPKGSGFQTIQSFLSFHSGHLFGVGIGNGNSKLFFLPEVHTDFIFSLIGEELGFVGAAVVLVLFVYFGYCLFKVSFRAPDPLGTYLAFGLSLSLLLQIAVNLGGVTGILPVKGLPLPFISWGRSALFVNLTMMGILLNIARQSGIIQTANRSEVGQGDPSHKDQVHFLG